MLCGSPSNLVGEVLSVRQSLRRKAVTLDRAGVGTELCLAAPGWTSRSPCLTIQGSRDNTGTPLEGSWEWKVRFPAPAIPITPELLSRDSKDHETFPLSVRTALRLALNFPCPCLNFLCAGIIGVHQQDQCA